MFSESELVFLAFVFIVTLGCFMLGRRRRDIPPVRRPNKKKRKRINCNPCFYQKQNKQPECFLNQSWPFWPLFSSGRRDSPPVRRPNKKKQKRVKCNHCSLNGQNKNKRPPEENDDDESYNSRGTLFR
ncbi:unnamed protein product [Porites evermanni]|uniref:Uncharacterized protein n=1 Tax=Porites evermanni TaxID=104178 RepID=A0ABN8LJ90_9CNID|nr:unnamed protein product [Porites evermanni]